MQYENRVILRIIQLLLQLSGCIVWKKIKGQILMLLFVFAQFYLVESVENVSVSGEIRILQNYMISSVD